MAVEQLIIERFTQGLQNLAESGRVELIQQGHEATGKLVDSIEPVVVSANLEKLVGVIYAEDYGLIVDAGVSSGNVPFSGTGKGDGSPSLYIEGLLRWSQTVRPNLSEKERKSFVFAVAHTHKKEGIPTSGSFVYANNNRRTGWIENGLEAYVPILENDLRLFDLMSRLLEDQVDEALK